jgi:hypothetical protein
MTYKGVHPALRNFLRGYLHEDFAAEYGSLAAAVADFKQHTYDWEAVAMVTHQLHAFIHEQQGRPIEEVNAELAKLGAGYEFLSWDELLEFERLLYS